MLNHPTLEKLTTLKLSGMCRAFKEQMEMPDIEQLSFTERLGLMVDREVTERENRKLAMRLKNAKFKLNAAVEDIDYAHQRGLEKSLVTTLATGQWIRKHQNILLVGPTGAGKTYLACALGHSGCLRGFSAFYARIPRLVQELGSARGDGRYSRMMKFLAKTDLLILDDLGITPLTAEQRRDLLEIFDDRYDNRATLVTSQLPVNKWHEAIGDPTLADAILDRLVHNAHKLVMKGESMRKTKRKVD